MPPRIPRSPAQSLLRKLIVTGLAAADPYHALLKSMSCDGHLLQVGRRTYNLDHIDRIVAVGAGKASARMAQAIEHILETKLEQGLVVVRPGHRVQTRQIAVVEASHPIPDRADGTPLNVSRSWLTISRLATSSLSCCREGHQASCPLRLRASLWRPNNGLRVYC